MIVSGRVAFTLFLCGCAVWFLAETLTLSGLARLAPLSVILLTCILLFVQLALELWPGSSDRTGDGSRGNGSDGLALEEHRRSRLARKLSAVLWLGGLVFLVVVLGVLIGIPVFLLSYAAIQWKLTWWRALAIGAAAFAVLHVGFSIALDIHLAPGWMWSKLT